MKRSWVIGILLALIVAAAGLSVTWLGSPTDRLAVVPTSAQAQTTSNSTTNTNQAITDSGQSAIQKAIAEVGPAVVRVEVTATVTVSNPYGDLQNDPFFKYFFGTPNTPQKQEEQALGSGIVIDYQGQKVILTNAHVVDGATSIRVMSTTGKTWTAKVLGKDNTLDVAVLKLDGDASSLPTAQLGDSSKIKLGEWAIAIGNPLGLSNTVTMGIVSATNRDIPKPNDVGYYYNMIQTDAAINPGNSGGPLVNAEGQVIGINTAILRESGNNVPIEGINFAISINPVKEVLGQLINTGKVTRAWLGVTIQDITQAMAKQFGVEPGKGVVVADVLSGSPAAKAGMKTGDVITQIDGQAITSASQLQHVVMFEQVGKTVTVNIVRDKKPMSVQVTLGTRPSDQELYGSSSSGSNSSGTPSTTQGVKKFGLTVAPVTSSIAQSLGLNSTQGVVIMDVAAGSAADWAGLQAKDVILAVNLEPVKSISDWNTIVGQLSDSATPMLTVFRDGMTQFVTLGQQQ
jgi:serine protease Do